MHKKKKKKKRRNPVFSPDDLINTRRLWLSSNN